MDKPKIAKIEVCSSYHSGKAFLRARIIPTGIDISPAQSRLAWNKVCGIDDCQCPSLSYWYDGIEMYPTHFPDGSIVLNYKPGLYRGL